MNRNVYYIDCYRAKMNVAGPKAQNDVAELCRRTGYKRLCLIRTGGSNIIRKLQRRAELIVSWLKIIKELPDNSIVIYQHPTSTDPITQKAIPWLQKKRNCKFICIIHDLESLRGGIRADKKKVAKLKKADVGFLKDFDCLICHNSHMKDYMIKSGFQEERLISLEIFDYLTDTDMARHKKQPNPEIAIAGSLDPRKVGYIYDIINVDNGQNKDLKINLYGSFYEPKSVSANLIYKGSFSPEELPGLLEGNFGLVWDGTSVDTCAGNTGEYLRYNNPHKTSLYLAAGIPVIVWTESAISDFVLGHGVGIAVDNLRNLEETIRDIDPEMYESMALKAAGIGEKIRAGYYFYSALDKAFDAVEGGRN